jgi:hypothetical protein
MMKRKFETISQNNEDLEQNEPASKKRRLIAGPITLEAFIAMVVSTDFSCNFNSRMAVLFQLYASSLRLVSRQLCSIIDNEVPCFAFLKMIKEEVKRVKQSKEGLIESPWLTQYEAKLIVNNGQIDMNEPLPSQCMIPLTSLLITTSTRLAECEFKSSTRSSKTSVEFHHALPSRVCFTLTITDKDSPLIGKEMTIQQHQYINGNFVRVVYTTEPALAQLIGIPEYTPSLADKWEAADDLFALIGECWRKTLPIAKSELFDAIADLFSAPNDQEHNPSTHYLRSYWDPLPTVPVCLARLLQLQFHQLRPHYKLQ